MANKIQVNVNNEFGTLKSVLVARADTYYDHEPINDNQTIYYKKSPPDKAKLLLQQKNFFEVMSQNGICLVFADALADCPDQLNTRDPSFVIGNTFFVSSMKESLRCREKEGLLNIIKNLDASVVYLDECTIEGGDVVVAGVNVFVGISRRTTYLGVQRLKSYLNDNYRVIPIELKSGFLHLDTVFNILSDNIAIICEDAIVDESVALIKQHYSVINISLEEQLHLGTNVFSIAPGKIISQEYNKRINDELRSNGFDVIELDYSEPAKLGGAFRCGTCPLERL